MEVGAHSDAHFQLVGLNASRARLNHTRCCFELPRTREARITPRVATQNPTHAQSRQGDSKRYLEGLKRKRDSN